VCAFYNIGLCYTLALYIIGHCPAGAIQQPRGPASAPTTRRCVTSLGLKRATRSLTFLA
jgi:hypothetical protein